jgi:hypothetical protein
MSEQQQPLLWPDGQPFDQRRCLFAPPPTQIGSVRVASSSLPLNRVWTKALSGLGFQFRHTLGYLGEKGVACFECDRNPGRLIRREVLVFEEAANLFARSTSTSFEFLWKDPLDRLLFRYEGVTPPEVGKDHILNLLEAAESAWTQGMLSFAMGNLRRGGSMEFPVLGQGILRLSQNSLSLGSQHFSREDLECFKCDPASLEICASYKGEARGLQSIAASTAEIGNVEVLHQLLVQVLHLPVRD